MVDLSKISQAVQKFVDEVKSSEGNKRRIDTQRECDKLARYLSGNRAEMNSDEVGFIEGLMVEYTSDKEAKQAAEKEEAFLENVTDSTKDFVKNVAKHTKNKKQINTEAEAKELVRYLEINKNELKTADKEYVKKVLIEAGYEDLLVDRVGELEKRADEKDALDAEQTEAINKNAEQNAAQDKQIDENTTRNNEQDKRIGDNERKDRAQDKKIGDNERKNKEQDQKIKGARIKDSIQDLRISKNKEVNRQQDDELRRDRLRDWYQDRKIRGLENEMDEHKNDPFGHWR